MHYRNIPTLLLTRPACKDAIGGWRGVTYNSLIFLHLPTFGNDSRWMGSSVKQGYISNKDQVVPCDVQHQMFLD